MSIGKLMDDHLSRKLDVRESTRKRDRSVVASLIESRLDGKTAGTLQQEDVQRWVAELQENGFATETIRKSYQLLSAAFELAIDRGFVTRNPCRNVKVPSIRKPERPNLALAEIFALAEEVPKQYRAMILLAGLSGLRWEEVAGLRRSRLQLIRPTESGTMTRVATVTVDATLGRDGKLHPPKTTGSRATVALPEVVVEALIQHLADREVRSDGLVFTTPEGKPLDCSHFRIRIFTPAIEAVGRPDVTFHSLRHSAGALLQQQGEHIQVIQSMMRHEDIRTTLNTYGHMAAGISEQAASAVDRAVLKVGAPILRPRESDRVIELPRR